MDTERYLADLEDRIVPPLEAALRARWVEFAEGDFSGDLFSPRRQRRVPPAVEWPEVRVNAALNDFDAMTLQQLRMCSSMLAEGDGRLLCVRCNYGTGILPTLFGAELFVMDAKTNTLPTVRPMGRGAIERLVERGLPDLHAGLGGKVFAMAGHYRRVFAPYPKIKQYVTIYHPDTQGPMDIVELLWGSELFTDVVDRPDLVHALLDLVTETYIAFMHEWQRRIAPENGHAVHWSLLHRGRIMLRDDSAMNFSPAMFDEFIRPYEQRCLDEFGGGAIHFCGRGDHWIGRLSSMRGVFAVNLSQPECNDMEAIYRGTVDEGVNLIGLPRIAADTALAGGRDLHGRVHCF